VIKEQNGEIDRLKNIIRKKEEQIKELRGKMDFQKKHVFRPLKCPYCGFEKVYKNGSYKIKIDKFVDELKKGEEKEITVQQFICPYCKSSIHNQKKKRRIIIF